jgi:tagatose-1,6-bisphosphate aldolase non-catalytic subunit AgaZ/GatZ
MTANNFRDYVQTIAAEFDFPADRVILGGDHLGPNPWRAKPAAQAMTAAKTMVEEYIGAGFTKVHLDASMACADDPKSLRDEIVAARAADLCQAAESVADPASMPYYIMGTERAGSRRCARGPSGVGRYSSRRHVQDHRDPSKGVRGAKAARGRGIG